MTIIDLFAGPGGWSTGLNMLGLAEAVGIEWDKAACDTARAAGHNRLQADIATLDPLTVALEQAAADAVEAIIASPPCQGFSMAGKGKGRADAAQLIAAVADMGSGIDPRDTLHATMADDRSVLALEPLRWVLALEPDWTAWEQVPAVLPLWEACAEVLRADGYDVWTGTVQAEQYGVPQTRKRAILTATRTGTATRPTPVLSRYNPRNPAALDAGTPRWVSMAEALGAHRHDTLRSNYGSGGDPKNRGLRRGDQPAPTVTSKAGRNRWASGGRITMGEAAVLQSFPADYPWQGPLTEQYRQVGDAVPPLLAAHVLASLGVGTLAAQPAA